MKEIKIIVQKQDETQIPVFIQYDEKTFKADLIFNDKVYSGFDILFLPEGIALEWNNQEINLDEILYSTGDEK